MGGDARRQDKEKERERSRVREKGATGEEIRERRPVCRHTEGLARRPKRITEFVFSWTVTGVVPSFLSFSCSSPSLFSSLASPPPLAALSSRLFQFLSPERNAMATLRGTKFRRKFLRKSHCHLSRSLIRRTYRSSRRVSTRETVVRSLSLSRSPSLYLAGS